MTIADSLTCAKLQCYHALILSIAIQKYRMMIVRQSSQGSPMLKYDARTNIIDIEIYVNEVYYPVFPIAVSTYCYYLIGKIVDE